MTPDLEKLQFVCRANIGKYERLLKTFLTDEERQFVKRRLVEEQASLQQLGGNIASEGYST